jgi:tetratricopeptide (TPR) repeat protein
MTSSLLREAITAVKANQRLKARTLLRELLAAEPTNEMAWIWLSEASDEWNEKVYALQQALEINPARTAVQTKLSQLQTRSKSDPAQEKSRLAEAVALAGDGYFQEARNSLIKLAEKDQNHVPTWLLLSTLVDNIEDKIVALENVLQLIPHHADAQKLLKHRLQGEVDKLTQGRAFEKQKDLKNAILAYETAVIISPLEEEKEIAERRLAELNKDYSPYAITSPTLTLVRLAAGLPILYGLLLLIHSGMNPSQIPLSSCFNGLFVIMGGLLWTAARHTTDHPYWQHIPPFITKKRQFLAIIGLILSVTPFFMFIMNAITRLAVYRASLP